MLSFKVNKENGNVDKFDTHLQPPEVPANHEDTYLAMHAVEETPVGKKFDSGKLDWTLMPFSALEDAVRVLMFGAKKYGRFNWTKLEDAEHRYTAALLRHLFSHLAGEKADPETGIGHMAHVLVNAMFIEWLRQQREGK